MPKIENLSHGAFKYRIYPTFAQRALLEKNFGTVRFVWNQLVANFNSYNTDAFRQKLTDKELKTSFPWMKEKGTIASAIQQKVNDFNSFKNQLFNPNRKSKVGRPNFKKKGVSADSFRIPAQGVGYEKCLDYTDRKIRCPLVGWIKCRFDRKLRPGARPLSLTFSKTKTNEYYVSVCFAEPTLEPLSKTYEDVGIDLGLTHLAILSNGTKIENPKWFRKSQAKLKRAQRAHSRKMRGSKRKEKSRLRVAKIHQFVSRQRRDHHHKISSALVKSYDTIAFENLNVKGMAKNRKLAKSISDAGWRILVDFTSYKAKAAGKEVLNISRWFPSTKTCSDCGVVSGPTSLADRQWTCSCGSTHDRDVNAAKNILGEALREHHGIVPFNKN